MEYQPVILSEAEKDMDRLPQPLQTTIVKRIFWLAQHATQVIHHPLAGMPDDLKGLCKLRIGDYRVLYWKEDAKKRILVYRVRHRSEVYRRL